MDKKTYSQLKTYKIISLVAIIACISLVVYIFIDKCPSCDNTLPDFASGERMGNPPKGMRGGFMDFSDMIEEDGNIDISKVNEMKSRFNGSMPDNYLEMTKSRLDREVENGSLTQEQAKKIYEAITNN